MANIIIMLFIVIAIFPLVNPVFAMPYDDFPFVLNLPLNNFVLFDLASQSPKPCEEQNIARMIEHIMNENAIKLEKIHIKPLIKSMQIKVRGMFAKLKACRGGRAYQKTYDKWKMTNFELKVKHKTGSPTKRKLEEQLQSEQQVSKRARKEIHETQKKLFQAEKETRELQRRIDRLVRNKQKEEEIRTN